MDVGAPFITDGQAAETVEPGQRAFDDPAVPAQPFAAVDAASGNSGRDPAFPAFSPTAVVIVSLVGVKLIRPLARAAATVAHTWHGVEGGCQHQAVVAVGRAQPHPERGALAVDHKMALRARFDPRSVGFGPISAPPFSPARRRCRGKPGSSPDAWRPTAARAAPDGTRPRRRPPASHEVGASRSCRSSRTHAAASPRECQSGARR